MRAGEALCAGEDGRLVVAITDAERRADVADALAGELAISRRSIEIQVHPSLPRLTNGKPDHASLLRRLDTTSTTAARRSRHRSRRRSGSSVEAIYADVLGTASVAPTATFVSLGGDSLSYVELSVRLEEHLGSVPRDWHVTPIGQLAAVQPRRRRLAAVETTVVLRALAIVMIVANHMKVFRSPGGAHVLLAVVGFNFARFQLTAPSSRDLLRRARATVTRVAVPVSLWIGVQMATVGGYSVGALLLVNNYTGSSWRREGRWQYWFFEALVQIFVVATVLLMIPFVRRTERRHQFAFPLALLALSLLFRFEVVQVGDPYNYLFRTHTVVWFFLVGWTAERSRTILERAVVSAVVLASVPGFFDLGQREVTVIAGLLLLAWVPRDRRAEAVEPRARGSRRSVDVHLPGPLAGVAAAATAVHRARGARPDDLLRDRGVDGGREAARRVAAHRAPLTRNGVPEASVAARQSAGNTDTGELTRTPTSTPGAGS